MLQLPERTVTEWFQLFREVCAFIIINYTEAIGGPEHIIDLREYQLDTQEDVHDFWIFTGIDRSSGNNFAIHLENLESDTIWPVLKNYILPGSIVVTPRYKEFAEKENDSGNEGLQFVHPSHYPRNETDLQLDDMFSDMQQFVAKEMHCNNEPDCVELYVYQYLYFMRDIYCNKPASELILPFLNDVKQVFPGFEKLKHLSLEQ